jgi:hypothetical protein
MSCENRLWGTERIRGELLKLGIVVSNRSIRRYRWRGPRRSPSQTWRTFLRNHAHHLWAADLLTVPTLTFKTLYVLVFIAHGRRELVHVNMTANPTAAWVWRQLIEATPWGTKPQHLLRDRDAVYGRDHHIRDGSRPQSFANSWLANTTRSLSTIRVNAVGWQGPHAGPFRSLVETPIRGPVTGTSDGPTSACRPGRMAY